RTPESPLFPYTTLFRSGRKPEHRHCGYLKDAETPRIRFEGLRQGRNPLSDTTGTTSDRNSSAASAPGTLPETKKRRRAGTGLASMLMPELQQMAQSLGITSV